MSPKHTIAVINRIFVHCGQASHAEKLAEYRESILREIGVAQTECAGGKAKGNKVDFGSIAVKKVLSAVAPEEFADKSEKEDWQAFSLVFCGAWMLAVGTNGNVPMTADEIAKRDAELAAKTEAAKTATK
jgi:hypothetical protein